MSAPSTPTLDNFTRANENPLSHSGAWDGNIFSGPTARIKLLSDEAVSTASPTGEAAAYWATSFASEQEAWVKLAGTTSNPYVACSLSDPGGTPTGYILLALADGSGVELLRQDSGGATSLGVWEPVAPGTVVGLWVNVAAGVVSAYYFDGTSWDLAGTASDATYNSGYIGIGYYENDASGSAFTSFGGGSAIPVYPVVSKRGLYLTVTDLAGNPLSETAGRPLPLRTVETPQVTIPLSDSRTGQFSVSMYEPVAKALVDSGTPTSAATVVVKVLYVNPKGDESLVLNGILMNPDADFDGGTIQCTLHDHTIRLKNRYLGYDHASIMLSWGITVNAIGEYYSEAVLDDVGLGEFYEINSVFGVPLDGLGLRLLLLDTSHGASDWPGGGFDGIPSMGIRYTPGTNSVDDANQQPAYVVTDGNAIPPTGVGGVQLNGDSGNGFTAAATDGSAVLEEVSFVGSTDKAGDVGSWGDLYVNGALYGPGVPQFAVIDSFDEGAGTITMSLEATENTGVTSTGANAYYLEDAVYCQLTRGDCVYDDITDIVQAQGAFECDWVPIDAEHTGFSGADWVAGQFVELYTANRVGTDRSKGNGSVTPVQFVHGLGGFRLTWSPDATQLVTYAVQAGSGGDVDPNDYLNKAIIISSAVSDYGYWEQWAQATSAGDGDTLTSNTVLLDRARAVLTAYQNPPQFITATVDTDVIGAYCYGTDYFLGDVVTVYAKKGVCEVGPLKVRITQIGISQVDESGNCQIQLTMVPYLTSAPGVGPDVV